ncbi:MAG: hypothetical protein RR394_07745, partial [Oscillospiraceae bacterium]
DYANAQDAYMNATNEADKAAAQAAMNVAHDKAESVRADSSGNYSGGFDGSQYIPLPGDGGGGYTPSYTYHTISASSGTGGSISPAGSQSVVQGGSISFSITPNKGYRISVVTVDGAAVGAVGSYTFSNITSTHSISASFVSTGSVDITGASLTDSKGKNLNSGSIKSGYGIFANLQVNCKAVENVVVTAEYKFGKAKQSVKLVETSSGNFSFPINPKSTTAGRCVYIPVETKDGKYTITFTVTGTDAAGKTLTATSTNTITIKGNMYEDDFTGES